VVGLVVAIAAFFAMAAWYARFRGHWSTHASLIFGLAAALIVVLAIPFIVAKLDAKKQRTGVAVTVPETSRLDIAFVAERPQAAAQMPAFKMNKAPPNVEIRYSVGFRDRRSVRWVLLDTGDPHDALEAIQGGGPTVPGEPEHRADADELVVLLVDGTPPVIKNAKALPEVPPRRGEVPRWRRVARAAGGRDAPAFALLQTTDLARLRDWTDPDSPVRPVSIQKELASPTVADAAVQLATGAPGSREDFELAMRHEPVLLFDSGEPVPRPLSVDALIADHKVSQCDDTGTSTGCEAIAAPRMLKNGANKRLELDLPSSGDLRRRAKAERDVVREGGPAALTMGHPLSTIYVHPTTREVNGRRFLYLDYWWYLPDNPARSGWGSFCGAGLVIPGVTCFNHQSDWEGITVIVDRTERRGRVSSRPIFVQYAQHDSVVRYDWDELRRHWDGDNGIPDRVQGIPGIEERPLVFVAMGTHASYASRCLQLLPTHKAGAQPALWSAFDGPWGARRCVFEVYCNSGDPPHGPGQQGRYRRPALANGEGNLERGKRRFERGTVVSE
jgi:hypothetical protein